MNDQMVQEVMKRVDALSDKLGVGAQVLWSALVRQAPIDATCNVVVLLIGLAGFWLLFSVLVPWARRATKAYRDDEIMAVVASIIVGTMSGILVLAFLITLDQTLAGFLNPDYWALKHLLPSK